MDNRRVCISNAGNLSYGNLVFTVESETAAKMLEVYDKEQKFEPIEIDDCTSVECVDVATHYVLHPIKLRIYSQPYDLRCFSIEESQKLRKALEAAETWVINHRN